MKKKSRKKRVQTEGPPKSLTLPSQLTTALSANPLPTALAGIQNEILKAGKDGYIVGSTSSGHRRLAYIAVLAASLRAKVYKHACCRSLILVTDADAGRKTEAALRKVETAKRPEIHIIASGVQPQTQRP